MADKLIKGFCTKYALTEGIYPVKVRRPEPGARWVYTTDEYRTQLRVGVDFFESKEDAVRRARRVAHRRVESLRISIALTEPLVEAPKWRKEKP